MLAKILRLKKSAGKSSEDVRQRKVVSSGDKVTAGGDGEQYSYPANVAFPFRDEKATSFPAPLSIDVSVLTDGQKSTADSVDAAEGESQDGEKKKKKKKEEKHKKVDQEDETEEEKQKDVEKDVSPDDDLKETCSPEACNRILTQKTPVGSDFIPTKFTEMINTSIKEAVQTIVKQCSMVPEKQENEKPASKIKDTQDSPKGEAKVCDKDRRKEKTRDRKQHHRSRSTKVREKSGETHLSPYRHKRSSSARKSSESKKEKALEERSKKLSKLEKNLKADNRRMTGNVNIYICSEANESTEVNGKKKDKAPPCVESSSETTTERSNGTSSRRDSSSSSKLMERIEKRRKKLQKEREQLDCLCEEVSSRNGSEASSSLSSGTWRTECKNSRPATSKRDNDLRNVQDSSSGDIAVLDSFSTSSTRDGCLCNGTNVSGTDMVTDSDMSLPKSRFTIRDRNLYESRVCPVKSQVSSIESDNWEPTTVCTDDHSKHRAGSWTKNVDRDRECRCVEPPFSSFENSWKKRNVQERKKRRYSDRNRQENWSTCSCIREEDEDRCSNVGKVPKVPSEKLTVCKTSPVEQTRVPEKVVPCPAFSDDPKSSPKEITVCCNDITEGKPKHKEQTVCTNVVYPVEAEKKTARDSKDAEEKDVLDNGEEVDTSRQTSLDETQREGSKDEESRRESFTPRRFPGKQTTPRKIADTKRSPGKTVGSEAFADKDKEVDRSESKKTLDEGKKESFLSRLLKMIVSVFKSKQGKAEEKKKDKADDEAKVKEMEERKDGEDDKIKIAADGEKKIEAKDTEEDPQRPKTTGRKQMKKVRSIYSLDKGERPKTKLEVILESRKGVTFTPQRSMVFRKTVAGGEANEEEMTDDNGSYSPRRKAPISASTGKGSRKPQTIHVSVTQGVNRISTNSKKAKTGRAGEDSSQNSEIKSSTLPGEEKDPAKPTTARSSVGPSTGKRQLSRFRQSISADTEKAQGKSGTPRTSIAAETAKGLGQYQTTRTSLIAEPTDTEKDATTRKDATSDEEKIKKDTTTYVPCEGTKTEEERKVYCRCKQPSLEHCDRTDCSKCKKPAKDCCCEKKEKKTEVCCDCSGSSKPERLPKCGPCCKCNEPIVCEKCCRPKTDCKCKKIVVCVDCCRPKTDCRCRMILVCTDCKKMKTECMCGKPSICTVCCRPKIECKCRDIVICADCCKPVEECSCRWRKSIPLAKCCKPPEICWHDKSMVCVYCEKPRDHCTCREPIQKCSYCGLLLDVCNCKNPETCSLVGREILNDKDRDRMMYVTTWRPRKDVKRYFSRNAEDECRCHGKPKPYGCEELPYQRLSVFSNVMNELQHKIRESVCCTRCRRVPCCCGTKFDEKDEKTKYRIPDNCRCGATVQKSNRRERTPPLRICCVCRTSPCRCKKAKSLLRKPRAKCYYCKSSPCTCVAATENNKARPCRCSTSPYRGKEEEIRSRAKPPTGTKNDGKLFCVRGSKVSICPVSRKQRHRENSENVGRRRRKSLGDKK